MKISLLVAAIGMMAAMPLSVSAQVPTATATLYWPKLISYDTNSSGYADVPGHSRHSYLISGTAGSSVLISLVKSTLFVHTATAVSSETNISTTLNGSGKWSRNDSLWLTVSLPAGVYNSNAKSELTVGGLTASVEDPSSFSVVAPTGGGTGGQGGPG
jgi:hypothetical protein